MQQYVDVVTYLLAKSDVPPGVAELSPDIEGLGRIPITPRNGTMLPHTSHLAPRTWHPIR